MKRKVRRSQSSSKKGLDRLVLDRAEAVEAAEVVHAVHTGQLTAVACTAILVQDSNFSAPMTVDMRGRPRRFRRTSS
jgi:hypothetical protein